MSFDKNREYKKLDYRDFLPRFEHMDDVQKFKMVATAIYEFSLTTKQWSKEAYFRDIGISAKNPLLREKVKMIKDNLGFLYTTDIQNLEKLLKDSFPYGELVRFGALNERGQFKQSVAEGLIVIPNLDLYTNMCTGLKYRKTKAKAWIDNSTDEIVVDKIKEPEFSFGRIADPLPYHLTRESLLDESVNFRFFEGMKDLHSIPSRNKICDVAIPGVNGISEEMLGLFRGRTVELYFDQDKAGQEGAMKLKKLLEDAGAVVINITWDLSLGGDVNEVLKANHIIKIINQKAA